LSFVLYCKSQSQLFWTKIELLFFGFRTLLLTSCSFTLFKVLLNLLFVFQNERDWRSCVSNVPQIIRSPTPFHVRIHISSLKNAEKNL
jgi:hypothetical protein